MIRLIQSTDNDALSYFLSSANPKSSLFHEALIGTYGLEQPFFKVYIQVSTCIDACISILDNSAFLTLKKSSDTDELHSFLKLNPFIQSVAMDKSDFDILNISEGFDISFADLLELKENVVLPKPQNEIDILPKIDSVYAIMNEHFTLKSYDEFKSDMLHRINHCRALSAAVYAEDKIISCASILFKGDTAALIGGVCTDSNHRKKGLASHIVSKLCTLLRSEGILPLITCKSESGKRIYLALGFTPTGKRYTLTKK